MYLVKVNAAGTGYEQVLVTPPTTGTKGLLQFYNNAGTIVASFETAETILSALDPLMYKGVIDCAADPNYPAASVGHIYLVGTAGKIGGASGKVVESGDMLICNTDVEAGDETAAGASWNIVQTNLTGVVLGPATATDNAIARYDSTTGKLLQDSLVTIDDAGSVNILSGQSYKINGTALAVGDITGARKAFVAAPAAANSTGAAGDEAYDADYYYVCVATDTWKRIALATWA